MRFSNLFVRGKQVWRKPVLCFPNLFVRGKQNEYALGVFILCRNLLAHLHPVQKFGLHPVRQFGLHSVQKLCEHPVQKCASTRCRNLGCTEIFTPLCMRKLYTRKKVRDRPLPHREDFFHPTRVVPRLLWTFGNRNRVARFEGLTWETKQVIRPVSPRPWN